jgi:hypothetical protein
MRGADDENRTRVFSFGPLEFGSRMRYGERQLERRS